MRTLRLGVSLALVLIATPLIAQEKFKDVPPGHWAYEAVTSLQAAGIVVGYPDAEFRGKRTLTRNEFAVALDRAIKRIVSTTGGPGVPGGAGTAGEQGAEGPAGPPGMTPEEIATFRRLLGEFKEELTGLGNNLVAINSRLDKIASDVSAIHSQLDRMPKFYGGVWTGFWASDAHGPFVDRDGRRVSGGGQQAVVDTLAVGVRANIAGGARFNAEVLYDNYKGFLGGSLSQVRPLQFGASSDTYLHHLEITTPFTGIGRNSELTIGRFGESMGWLTYARPEVNSYFRDPFDMGGGREGGDRSRRGDDESTDRAANSGKYGRYEGGKGLSYGHAKPFYIDGARLKTQFGSVRAELFAGQNGSVTGVNDGPWNNPLAGATNMLTNTGIFVGSTKPFGLPFYGQIDVDQSLGLRFRLPVTVPAKGSLGITLLDVEGGNGTYSSLPGGFSSVFIPAADARFNFADHFNLHLDWAKSITDKGRFQTVNAHQNNAFDIHVGYHSNDLQVNAGYRYIDPLFGAPGYWGKIGNWINPTNVKGPQLHASYRMCDCLDLYGDYDCYTPIHNRSQDFGFASDDSIERISGTLRWNVNPVLHADFGYETDFWTLKGLHNGIPSLGADDSVHPTEQYIKFGARYDLTPNTRLRLDYNLGDFNGHNALTQGAGTVGHFGVFTGQLAVKF